MFQTHSRHVCTFTLLAGVVLAASCLLPSCKPKGTPRERRSEPQLQPRYPDRKQRIALRALIDKQRDYDEAVRKRHANALVHYVYGSEKHRLLLAGTEIPRKADLSPCGGGLWVSKDGGSTWRLSAQGFAGRHPYIHHIVEDTQRDVIYVSTDDGVYRSVDGAKAWERFSEGLPYEHRKDGLTPEAHRLSLDPQTGDLYGRLSLDGFGVYKTGPAKPAWQAIGKGLTRESSADDVCYAPEEQAVYVIMGGQNVLFIKAISAGACGIYAGRPKGDGTYRWVKDKRYPGWRKNTFPALEFAVDPDTGDLYAAALPGLFRKQGDQWQLVLDHVFVGSVTFEEGGAQRALARTEDRLFLRTDGEWKPLTDTPWNRHATVCSVCFLKGAIYAATNDGLFRRDAAGWKRLPTPTEAARS